MAFTMITTGYGGSATIKCNSTTARRLLLNNFSLTMDNSIITGRGILDIWNSTNNKLLRYGTMALKDYAKYDLSISFEVTETTLFNELLAWIINTPRDAMAISFYDHIYDLSYSFSNAYIQGLTLTVSNNSIATIDITFYIVEKSLSISVGGFSLENKEGSSLTKAIGQGITDLNLNVMPYWKFKSTISSFTSGNLGFTLEFSQDITPKFGCIASTEANPQDPYKLIFSKPSISFSADYLINTSLSLSIINSIYPFEAGGFVINYGSKEVFTGGRAIIESISTSVADASSYQSISVHGSIMGAVTLEKII